jgi:hypothetical protein
VIGAGIIAAQRVKASVQISMHVTYIHNWNLYKSFGDSEYGIHSTTETAADP